MASDISLLFKTKNIKVIENASLAHLSYMKSGGYALALVMPNSIEEMCVCIKLLYENGVKYKVLGRMSNTMSDSGTYNGVVVKTDKLNRKSEAENIVVAECGTRLCDIIWSCAKRGFGGAEGLFLIPASLGGAVYNNAGAHGFCISDLILECEIYLPREDKRLWVSREKMGFGYRTSLFKNSDALLLSAKLKFTEKPFVDIKRDITEFAKIRRAAQPLDYPSLGSVFMRHEGIGAGYYIDKAGLKGLRIGGAEVSRKHAGFIINRGGASPEDIKALIYAVKQRVYECFGIWLKEEIEII